MTHSLRDKTAVVTGVTSGIGKATAAQLLAGGARVIGVARNSQKLAGLSAEFGERFSALVVDLGVSADRVRATAALSERAPEIDILISNAAECVYESPLTLAPSALTRLFETNVFACIELCQAIVPQMRPGSHLVQLSSVVTQFMPNARFGPYAASKAAIEQFVNALRLELHPKRIHVSLVRPGLVDTPIYDKVKGFDGTRAKLAEQVPAWLTAEDVAESICWLLSRPARAVISELTILPAEQPR
jgi:3-hydroxy acid dehydrogenase / malonic semialdehyde reductase